MALARIPACLSFLVLIAIACGKSAGGDGLQVGGSGSGGRAMAGDAAIAGGNGLAGSNGLAGRGGTTAGGAGSGGANANGASAGGSGGSGGMSVGGSSAGNSGVGGSNASGSAAGGLGGAGTSSGGTASSEADSGVESGGDGGAGGEAGGVGTAAYPLCDQDLGEENNPDCEPGTICRSGYCTGPCVNDITEGVAGTGEDCPRAETGDAFLFCGLGYCWLRCFNGETCPDGMVCNGVPDGENCWNPDALDEP